MIRAFLRDHWLYTIGHLLFAALFFACAWWAATDPTCPLPVPIIIGAAGGFFASFPWFYYMSGDW